MVGNKKKLSLVLCLFVCRPMYLILCVCMFARARLNVCVYACLHIFVCMHMYARKCFHACMLTCMRV